MLVHWAQCKDDFDFQWVFKQKNKWNIVMYIAIATESGSLLVPINKIQ